MALTASDKKLRRQFKNAALRTSKYILKDIEGMYENAINAFYNHYKPHVYTRTYQTFSASSAYPQSRLYSQKNIWASIKFGKVTGYNIKFTVDSDNYIVTHPYKDTGRPYHADTDWVLENTFLKGIHGTDKLPIMKPSPYSMLNSSFRAKYGSEKKRSENIGGKFNEYFKTSYIYDYIRSSMKS